MWLEDGPLNEFLFKRTPLKNLKKIYNSSILYSIFILLYYYHFMVYNFIIKWIFISVKKQNNFCLFELTHYVLPSSTITNIPFSYSLVSSLVIPCIIIKKLLTVKSGIYYNVIASLFNYI
jgi:hypothetical protein